MRDGTWEDDWCGMLFRLMRRDMPSRLRARLLSVITPTMAARMICRGRGGEWFTNQELRDLRPILEGVFYRHPGRHYIDEIPDG